MNRIGFLQAPALQDRGGWGKELRHLSRSQMSTKTSRCPDSITKVTTLSDGSPKEPDNDNMKASQTNPEAGASGASMTLGGRAVACGKHREQSQ